MLFGAAALAAWTQLRFHNLGPRSVTGGFLAFTAAFALIAGIPAFIQAVFAVGIPEPRIVVLFGLGLPTFTYFFLAGGWFFRSVLENPGRLN